MLLALARLGARRGGKDAGGWRRRARPRSRSTPGRRRRSPEFETRRALETDPAPFARAPWVARPRKGRNSSAPDEYESARRPSRRAGLRERAAFLDGKRAAVAAFVRGGALWPRRRRRVRRRVHRIVRSVRPPMNQSLALTRVLVRCPRAHASTARGRARARPRRRARGRRSTLRHTQTLSDTPRDARCDDDARVRAVDVARGGGRRDVGVRALGAAFLSNSASRARSDAATARGASHHLRWNAISVRQISREGGAYLVRPRACARNSLEHVSSRDPVRTRISRRDGHRTPRGGEDQRRDSDESLSATGADRRAVVGH